MRQRLFLFSTLWNSQLIVSSLVVIGYMCPLSELCTTVLPHAIFIEEP